MGTEKDVNLYRAAPRQLFVDAHTVAGGDLNVLGKFMVNGEILQKV